MYKLTVACTAVIVGLVGCTGERANSSPPENPPGVDVNFNAPEGSDSAKSEATEPSEAEPSKPEPAKANPPRESTKEAKPSPEACKGLAQKKCEVSVGCAWSTEKKCVPQ